MQSRGHYKEFTIQPVFIVLVNMMFKNIMEIMSDKYDNNPYATTYKAVFFATISEYFLKQQDILSLKRPLLYKLRKQVFNQHPAESVIC